MTSGSQTNKIASTIAIYGRGSIPRAMMTFIEYKHPRYTQGCSLDSIYIWLINGSNIFRRTWPRVLGYPVLISLPIKGLFRLVGFE